MKVQKCLTNIVYRYHPVPSMVDAKDESNENHLSMIRTEEQEAKLATVKMLLRSNWTNSHSSFSSSLAPINQLITHFAKELRMPEQVSYKLFSKVRLEKSLKVLQCRHQFHCPLRKSSRQSIELFHKSMSNQILPLAWVCLIS